MAQSGTDTTFGISKDIDEAQKRFSKCESWESSARTLWLEDFKFSNADSDNGWQWDSGMRNDRTLADRPCLTINMAKQHNLQIINDGKQNKPGIKIRATGGGATYESSQMLSSLVRYIERCSNASVAYDVATEFQVQAGIGYWLVATEYISDMSFDQNIKIKACYNPLNVYIDCDAKEKDKSDANYGFVFDDLPRDDFKRLYPQYIDQVTSQNVIGKGDNWLNDQNIRLCDYYRKTYKRVKLFAVKMRDGSIVMIRSDQLPRGLSAELARDQSVRDREVQVVGVERLVIAGHKVVQRDDWPGKYIPIVPVVGEEFVVEGKLHRKGHTRNLKDSQRMFNWWAPLCLNTPLPTPDGWTTMGYVREGDILLDDSGKPCKVLGTSPVHLHRKCYRVDFDDGSHIIADGEHKWRVEERGKRTSANWTWTTKTLSTDQLVPKKHFIYVAKPLDLPDVDLPIHPYALGVWLGDGDSNAIRITSGKNDIDEMREHLVGCGYAVGVPTMAPGASSGVLPIYNIHDKFRNLGLIGNKHIPPIYLRASKKQREQLLQGLMDTDGSIELGTRSCTFTQVSERLSNDFAELLRTLGIKAVHCMRKSAARQFPNGDTHVCQSFYQFSFTAGPEYDIFKLKRKHDFQQQERVTHDRRTKRHRIVSVREVPSVPVKCVAVDNESHLFLAGYGMVPTHNSAAVEYGALQTKIPWAAPIEAIGEFEEYWKNANRVNYPYLPYKSQNEAGETIPAPQRIEPPTASPVALAGMQLAQQDMMRASGQYEAQLGLQGNERSGKAIAQRQRQGDNSTYHFIDNQAISIRHTGRIILDLIPRIYDTERVLMAQAEDGIFFELTIDPKMKAAHEQRSQYDQSVAQKVLNPAVGEYEVEADVGPGFASKREEAFNAYTLLLTQAPDLARVIGDLLFKAADFPEADVAASRLRRMIPKEVLGEGPSPAEAQLGEENEKLKQLLTRALEEIAKAQIDVKAQRADKEVAIYDGITKRLKVVLDDVAAGKTHEREVAALIQQAVIEAMRTDAHVEAAQISAAAKPKASTNA